MKPLLLKACLCALTLGFFGLAYAAGTGDAASSVDTGKASGRVSGQGSAGGMQPATPGGTADTSAGNARPAAQGSAGGMQPVTPGTSQGTGDGKAKAGTE
ncbi:hypothetical protein [Caballeronia sp. M1242]|jgi:hypothetical protein|uniref:hypothetical protein n=1 Tax=Caballeronia sp. M1242 TaxID=2814653 RepID=UPI0019D2CE54|nr:hypothetical protein [Caballeronia sp. M1242]QSN64570.1 hypothetical protein JYK05_21150 [Caballeronia sp. M1242]